MLKGKQKKLDKNKDGKISGEDFKMMKARMAWQGCKRSYRLKTLITCIKIEVHKRPCRGSCLITTPSGKGSMSKAKQEVWLNQEGEI
jgi:hypothetical protein